MTYNRIMLAGNLVKDPELRYLPSGKAVCNLRLASSEKYRTIKGEQKEETLFIDVCIFGKGAENASTYLKKGRNVFVEGKLRVRDYQGRDGTARKAIEIIASRWLFAGGAPQQKPAAKPDDWTQPEQPAADAPITETDPIDEPMPSLAEEEAQ